MSREIRELSIPEQANERVEIREDAPSLLAYKGAEAGVVESGVPNPPFLALRLTFYSTSDCCLVLLATSVFLNNKDFPVQNTSICG